MAPIRRSNRARKPRDYWDPTNSPPHRRNPPGFTIYTEPFEHLSTQYSEHLEHLTEGLSTELSDKDLSSELDEDLSPELDKDLSEHLSRQLHEDLDVDPSYSSYQPQFLSKDRAGKSQNFSEDSNSLKLFQLFFSVKKIENIVKQTNQQATYIDFK